MISGGTFGEWRFDPRNAGLSRRDREGNWKPVAIGARAHDILGMLLRDPGALVTKDVMMQAVWPNSEVEPNNLTVQVAALRRILDDGQSGSSCIRTIPGRGYRFVWPVLPLEDTPNPAPADISPPAPAPFSVPAATPRPPLRWHAGAVALAFLCLLVLVSGWHAGWFAAPPARPLSVVVMPFDNLGGDAAEDYLADAVTDDLTAGLSLMPASTVITREAAYAYKGRHSEPRNVGAALGVRYVLSGSARRVGDTLRVNVQLASTDTNSGIWSSHFETTWAELGAHTDATLNRIVEAIGDRMIDFDAARGLRERPDKPDAIDLVLRGRSLARQTPSPTRLPVIRTLYERAEQLNPNSVAIKLRLVAALLDDEDLNPGDRKSVLERTGALLASAQAEAPGSRELRVATIEWLKWQRGRCPEAVELVRGLFPLNPAETRVYRWLGNCLVRTGQADEAVPVFQEAIRLGAGNPWQSHNYRDMQEATLLLGRYGESIDWGERALAANPEDADMLRYQTLSELAAAEWLRGQPDDARRRVAESHRIWRYATARSFMTWSAEGPFYAAQLGRLRDALRLAGYRDHADETADFGTPADDRLHAEPVGLTPLSVPGATTIRTPELVRLLATELPATGPPLVIDTMTFPGVQSIPGAVGLAYAASGGNLSGVTQDHLRAKLAELTHGDLGRPIVAVGWNSERFDGRNLALRLSALGYTRVFWYRGGREAWEVNALPETPLSVSDW